MSAQYIIRLDDICHTSNLDKWRSIEEILDTYSVFPIVAVIPENKDNTLMHQSHNPEFWKMIKQWERKGWTIAMHGYQHLYHAVNRNNLAFPYYDRSEFGGLPISDQKAKLRASLKIFRDNDIEPKLWVAPAHSFDSITLQALADETQINIVSDGIAFKSYYENGFLFIPQQLWALKIKWFGLWTVCIHPDFMTKNDIGEFRNSISLEKIHNNIIRVEDVKLDKNKKSLLDNLFSFYFWNRWRLASFIKRL